MIIRKSTHERAMKAKDAEIARLTIATASAGALDRVAQTYQARDKAARAALTAIRDMETASSAPTAKKMAAAARAVVGER